MKMRRWMLALYLGTVVGAVGCGLSGGHNLPPAAQLAHPGPGVGGPGPGVIPPPIPPMVGPPMVRPGGLATPSPAMAQPIPQTAAMRPASGAQVALASHAAGDSYDASSRLSNEGSALAAQPVQVLFSKPEGMQVQWDISGVGQFDSTPLVTPGRQNFNQGGIYRLKLRNIPGAGREGVELYPTLEIGPPAYRTMAYLAHNAIPIQLTESDFDHVLAGNFVTKVIYLPDPEFQGLAVADVATLVSTRLEPGLDPIEEAGRKGAILAILRVGNKDMEIPGVDMSSQVMPASFVSSTGNYGDCQNGSSGPRSGLMGHAGCGLGSAHHARGYPQATHSMGPGGMPPGLAFGMGAPQYGMPMSGTPIGLPGPPHIPLGVPAGLQKHVIKNHTKMHIPDPVRDVKVHVKQRPGQSYPHPVSRVHITEDTIHPGVHFKHHGYGPLSTGQILQGSSSLGCNGSCPTCN